MEPFKNNISPQLVTCIAGHLETHLEQFDRKAFEETILQDLLTLELKERAQLIAVQIHSVLPAGHQARAKIIRAMLHPNEEEGQQSDVQGICGWGMFPLCMVVGQYGLEDFEGSLLLLKDMTRHFSSEFDVRYYLQADEKHALAIMGDWVTDPNHHVRRLVSEGTRPRLPWGMRLSGLVADPSPLLPLLEALKDDETEYVRRSVANNLNDIAKDHPDLVAKIAGKWLKGANKNRERLVKHACRSLIKQGHQKTLKALGYAKPKVVLESLDILTPQVCFGEALVFDMQLLSTSDKSQNLIIDYVIYHQKANGTTSPKVFKWKQLSLVASKALRAQKKHTIKKITTRKYYPGEHVLGIMVNGVSMGKRKFELLMKK